MLIKRIRLPKSCLLYTSKHSAVPVEMHKALLRARPFDCEEDAIAAVIAHDIKPGDAVFIRYEGPKGSGMPAMFYTTEAISSDPELGKTIARITDGRFSGASKGPAIGHVSPEAAEGLSLIHISITMTVPLICGNWSLRTDLIESQMGNPLKIYHKKWRS